MAFQARDVLTDAAVVLIDEDHRRWTLMEKLGYLNEALREAVVLKPNLSTAIVVIGLQAGSMQSLPDGCTVMSEVLSNITTNHETLAGRVRGPAILPLPSPGIIDQMFPGWRSSALQSGRVQHVIYDLATPKQFSVFPANDGTGMIEAVVGQRLAQIDADGDQENIASYEVDVPVDDLYRLALTNFVIGKCFAKDSGIPGSAERAQAYLTDFKVGILGRATSEENIGKAAQGRPV